jgi:hypothetical protein
LDAGAKDNFIINETTGLITVAQDSSLDIQQNGDNYQIKVRLGGIRKFLRSLLQ